MNIAYSTNSLFCLQVLYWHEYIHSLYKHGSIKTYSSGFLHTILLHICTIIININIWTFMTRHKRIRNCDIECAFHVRFCTISTKLAEQVSKGLFSCLSLGSYCCVLEPSLHVLEVLYMWTK